MVRKIDKIFTVIRSKKPKIVLTRLAPSLWGIYHFDYGPATIYIRKSLSTKNKITTLIHECLHHIYFNHHENWIRKQEKEIFGSLTEKEYVRFEKIVNKLKEV